MNEEITLANRCDFAAIPERDDRAVPTNCPAPSLHFPNLVPIRMLDA
jgi:hypothetical protein